MLFASRLVQAVGTGLFFPSVTSVIMANSPAEVRGTRLALNSGVIAVGLAVSPTVSGFALTQFGWRSMFVVSLAMSAALLAVGFFRIRGGPSSVRIPIDALSVVLGPLGLAAFLYGLGEITHDAGPSVIALAAGAVLLALFAWRQFSLKDPLLDLHPLARPRFAVGILLVMVGMLTSFSMSILLPLYYEGALGRTAFFAGLLLLGPVLVNAAFTFLGGRLFDKHGAWPLIPAGLVLVLAGQAAAFFSAEGMVAVLIILSSAAVYAGAGFVVAPSKTAALGTLPSAMYPPAPLSTPRPCRSPLPRLVAVRRRAVGRRAARHGRGRGEGGGVRVGVRAHALDRRRHRRGGAAGRVLLCARHARSKAFKRESASHAALTARRDAACAFPMTRHPGGSVHCARRLGASATSLLRGRRTGV
ncbi:MAG: MFS transporter [Eggerthella lenta]